MAVRALRYAPEGHLEDMAYLIAHLKADPQAAELALNVEAASAALKTQSEGWRSTHHAVVAAQTGLENVAEISHNVVRTAHDVILDDVRHNRRSPKFLTYFPRGMVAIIRSPYLDELLAVRSLAQQCARDPSPKVREQGDLLRAAADQMHDAFERRAEARVAESVSYGQLQVQKLRAIDTCRRAGYRLAELYPDERDRVRSYFRQIYRRPREAAQTTAAPATEPEAHDGPVPAVLALTSATADLSFERVPRNHLDSRPVQKRPGIIGRRWRRSVRGR
jgi:hypothetical protein